MKVCRKNVVMYLCCNENDTLGDVKQRACKGMKLNGESGLHLVLPVTGKRESKGLVADELATVADLGVKIGDRLHLMTKAEVSGNPAESAY